MKICYINLSTNNPRDTVTINGLRENGQEILEITNAQTGWKKFWGIAKQYKEVGSICDLVIIGYTGAILVPLIWLIARKKIVYNALASFYESMAVSRKARFGRAYWLLDFIAFHLADLVLVESLTQKKFMEKTFFLRANKLEIHLTGVEENKFYYDPQIKKLNQFTLVFRGKFLPEAGIDVIIRTAKLLQSEKINFRIIGHGLLEREIQALVTKNQPTNLELIIDKLPIDQLRQKMQGCHIVIGQVAKHPRLENTIPHKAFESLAMRLPYLTGRQPAILELLKENETCFCVQSGNEQDLAAKILWLRDNPTMLETVAQKGLELYRRELTSKKLGQRLIGKLSSYQKL